MFSPFDGANYITGTVLLSALGIIAGNPPLVVLIAAPIITGIFMVLCKVIDIAYKSRTDKRLQNAHARIAELEAEIGKQTNR